MKRYCGTVQVLPLIEVLVPDLLVEIDAFMAKAGTSACCKVPAVL
jgi:hypothetical protein